LDYAAFNDNGLSQRHACGEKKIAKWKAMTFYFGILIRVARVMRTDAMEESGMQRGMERESNEKGERNTVKQ
jgi:hypothetical protein